MLQEPDIGLSEKDVQSLIEDVEKRKIVLPDFQRDFVWPTKQVGKLLESILNGYYINTLLTLPVVRGRENDNVPFPSRDVKGTPEPEGKPTSMDMILDGQQRITSLYYALTAPKFPLDNTKYPQLFYLKFSKVLDGQLDEDVIGWRRRDWDSSQRLIENDFELQMEKDMIPFTIFKSKQSFKSWRRGMEKFVKGSLKYDKDDVDKFDDYTEVFRNYPIPLIKMSHDTAPSTVVQTFERINTQGLELGVFDILTARLYPDEINLRNLWEDAIDEHARIEQYSEATSKKRARERALKILALYRGEECKDRNLRELDSQNFESDWKTATEIMERALEKARSSEIGGFGVTKKFGFPYGTMLPTLANLIYGAEESDAFPDQEALKKIQRWYWSSIFSKRYSGSSDTISYRDYNQMVEWMDGGETPEAIQVAKKIPLELDLNTLTRGGPYKGIMSLLVLNGAKDFGTFESITVHKVDDHHIFPNSKLEDGLNGKEYGKTARNRILNRTIIEYRNNRFKYKDELPSKYIPKMINGHPDGEKGIRKILQEHFVDKTGFEALMKDDYEAFCKARKRKIREMIEEKVKLDIDWSTTESVME